MNQKGCTMEFTLSLPDWAVEENRRLPEYLPTLEDRMAAVIRFSRLNFENRTGGPFAAGVFERDTGRPVVIGVNRVMAHNCSSAHAEVMTLSLAQKILGTWDLGAPGLPAHQLVVNWRPCAMCYGATLWSGIRSLVIAGSGPELEQITGFDEGPIHPEWDKELAKRGIELVNNVLTAEALKVYRDFAASGSFVYNPRQGEG
jgi:tRNA(Arg) A34 adenosine deaminase TadA